MSSPVALVTGGARRVGRAIVKRLAGAGYDVAFTYHHSREEAEELREALSADGARVCIIQADLTLGEAVVGRVFDEINGTFGRLDVLVNNASIYRKGSLGELNVADIQKMNAIHVIAPLLLCQAFEAHLRRGRGHVINMVDLLAERPWPAYLGYCASKAALANLTLSLARELAPEVTVNGIAPGVVEWPDDYPETERVKYLKRVPLGRAGSAEDVANLVHFLSTEGTYLTGQIIRLDGGRSVT